MKSIFIFIFVLITVESSAGPIGCQLGDEFVLVDTAMCGRSTCGNPAVMAYCYRTYKGNKRFQAAHPNCVKAFCENFSEAGKQDKAGETYRERYEEMTIRNDRIPSLKLVEDLYEVVCNEGPYNAEANRELFNRISGEHLKMMKAQKTAIKNQNSLWGRVRNFGIAPIIGGPTTINGSLMGNNGMGMNPMMMGGGMNPMMMGGGMNPMMMGGGMMPNQSPKFDPCETMKMGSSNGIGNNMNPSPQYDQGQQQYDQYDQQQW